MPGLNILFCYADCKFKKLVLHPNEHDNYLLTTSLYLLCLICCQKILEQEMQQP